jgi:hypothetical protein
MHCCLLLASCHVPTAGIRKLQSASSADTDMHTGWVMCFSVRTVEPATPPADADLWVPQPDMEDQPESAPVPSRRAVTDVADAEPWLPLVHGGLQPEQIHACPMHVKVLLAKLTRLTNQLNHAEICKTGIQQPLTAAYEFWQIPADRAMALYMYQIEIGDQDCGTLLLARSSI